MTIGEALKQLRLHAGLTQNQMQPGSCQNLFTLKLSETFMR